MWFMLISFFSPLHMILPPWDLGEWHLPTPGNSCNDHDADRGALVLGRYYCVVIVKLDLTAKIKILLFSLILLMILWFWFDDTLHSNVQFFLFWLVWSLWCLWNNRKSKVIVTVQTTVTVYKLLVNVGKSTQLIFTYNSFQRIPLFFGKLNIPQTNILKCKLGDAF